MLKILGVDCISYEKIYMTIHFRRMNFYRIIDKIFFFHNYNYDVYIEIK